MHGQKKIQVRSSTRAGVPGDWVWDKVLLCVVLPEKLHPKDGEDVDDNEEDEGEVAKGPKCRDDDAEENLHCGP